MHGESHVLRSDLCTLMYVLCHKALAKHFDLTIGLCFCGAAICMKSLDLMRICFKPLV